MSLELFLFSLALTLATVGTALLYLRGITRRVLTLQCGTDTGAEFWLRSADVLALAGSLILVVTFGGVLPGADWVQQLRLVLGLALTGLFATVVLVASSVWRNLPAPPQPQATAGASPARPPVDLSMTSQQAAGAAQ